MKELPARFWIESIFASATGLLLVVTLISRDWIEQVLRVDPDAGSGALEWAIVAVLLAATVSSGLMVRSEWSRAHRAVA